MGFLNREPRTAERFRGRNFGLSTGELTGLQYQSKLTDRGIYVSTYASDGLQRLQRAGRVETIPMIVLSLEDDISVHDYISWNDTRAKAQKETGLKLGRAPLDTAARLLLDQPNQIKEGWTYIDSDPFIGRDGSQGVFVANRNDQKLKLNSNWTDNQLNPNNRVAFRLRECQLFPTLKVGFFFGGFSRVFLQPPNILPTSSNFNAIPSHCLLEISFASQVMEIKNLSVSKSRIHSAIFSCLAPFSLK